MRLWASRMNGSKCEDSVRGSFGNPSGNEETNNEHQQYLILMSASRFFGRVTAVMKDVSAPLASYGVRTGSKIMMVGDETVRARDARWTFLFASLIHLGTAATTAATCAA